MDYIIGQKRGQPGQAPARTSATRTTPGIMSQPGLSPSPPPPAAKAGGMIVDGDQRSFMQDVVDASKAIPVLVDFWATWCGPCKTLTPVLEKIVTAAAGRIKLVKIDIDKNRALVQQLAQLGLPLQSVPTVAAFWQGQIADLFQGALPESEIRKFVDTLLKAAGGAMPAADMLAEARSAVEAGDLQGGAELFSALIEQDAESPEAWGGLIRTLLALGDEEQASDVLQQVPTKITEHAEVAGARAALALAQEGRQAAAQLSVYETRLAADPADYQARYDLATALNSMGKRTEAAEALLEILRRNRAWNEQAARLQLLKFFDAWGLDDPATLSARRRLSALLFS